MNLIERLRKRFAKVTPLSAGTFHFQTPHDAPKQYRLHLRLNGDGTGLLIVNAATILHLNNTAAEYAYQMIRGADDAHAAQIISSRYRVDYITAHEDYRDFVDRINTLIDTPDLDPITFLGFDRAPANADDLSAPLRLDCALTYRLMPGANPIFAPAKNVTRELTTAEWKQVIDRAWEFGIPHITFTGGEPTLRGDLIDLIAHAEKNGQVTGLLTDGDKLIDPTYLDALLQTGLDHLLFLLQPEDHKDWQALENVLKADIFTTVHSTITKDNASAMETILARLAEAGLGSISLSAASPDQHEALRAARFRAAEIGLSLVWDLPVPYSSSNPVALEDEETQTRKPVLYIEPDGDVLAEQGAEKILGNIVQDDWQKLWQ